MVNSEVRSRIAQEIKTFRRNVKRYPTFYSDKSWNKAAIAGMLQIGFAFPKEKKCLP